MGNTRRCIVFDTETTGLPSTFIDPVSGMRKYYPPYETEKYASSRLVQLAWIVTDETGSFIQSRSHLVRPDDFTIPVASTLIHGITHERASHEGKPLKDVLEAFHHDLVQCQQVVAHNFLFDAHVLSSECFRIKDQRIPVLLRTTDKFDTMTRTMQFFDLPKNPKLTETYKILFKQDVEQRHDALDDALLTAVCFKELRTIVYRTKLRHGSRLPVLTYLKKQSRVKMRTPPNTKPLQCRYPLRSRISSGDPTLAMKSSPS